MVKVHVASYIALSCDEVTSVDNACLFCVHGYCLVSMIACMYCWDWRSFWEGSTYDNLSKS